ncbi:MAG: bifunctional phosphopantothenoylcysteine decarboxylase/phosphopantothenate--cysteine ligase CoaBC [Neisseria sp.]|nr:bifunctional phosphopantothenoylcysteine decarboxylase/phosphopantothenate--cysteine ligase CoaBC [Neisseria sp.]
MPASRHILLGVTGGIAAYKSCEIVRLLKKAGHEVTVAMSRAATEFVHPNTFQALSGNPVVTETHGEAAGGMAHIDLTRRADVMLIAPATANTLAKIAHGMADNLITNLAAARTCPLVLAPAMNKEMWANPANLRNIKQLQQDGVNIIEPAAGDLACGETGIGRMREAAEIVDLLGDVWCEKVLAGKKVLLTVGATFEAIDPVRGITNLSSGRMGAELARACRAAGAQVSVVYGQMQAALPSGLAAGEQAISAQAMFDAVMRRVGEQDIFIGVAAVADYRVANATAQKWKKDQDGTPTLVLQENPDILAAVAALPQAPFCVGFAAESENVAEYARAKRRKKNVPLLVANQVSEAMGTDSNRIMLLDDVQETALPAMSKADAAAAIVTRLGELTAGK